MNVDINYTQSTLLIGMSDTRPWPDAIHLGFRAHWMMKIAHSLYIVSSCRGDKLIVDFSTLAVYDTSGRFRFRSTVHLCAPKCALTHGHRIDLGVIKLDGVCIYEMVFMDAKHVFIVTPDLTWIVMRPRTFCVVAGTKIEPPHTSGMNTSDNATAVARRNTLGT